MLVGDGINTNEAAARILLSWVQHMKLPSGFRYFLIVVKGANHQVNLAIGSVVSGRVARLGAEYVLSLSNAACADKGSVMKSSAPHKQVCGAIVRVFKYLISDYYADYFANLQELVCSLTLCDDSDHRQECLKRWSDMASLYGESVFPDGLLECLNGGLDQWTHFSADASPGSLARLQSVQSRLCEVLRHRILVVDEHPTLSRMFTFQKHVECFLLLHLLGILPKLVKFRAAQPREKSK